MSFLSRFVLTAAVTILPPSFIAATTPAPESGPSTLPAIGAIPLVLQYEFFPKYYSQTLSDNDRYSLIEGYIDDSTTPVKLRLALTEKKSGKKVYYTNDEAASQILKAQGLDAVVTPIDYVKPASSLQNVTAGFGFRDRDGQPVRWRFVYAYSVSPMGGGPSPAPEQPGVALIWRDQGTVAGQGAAVQIQSKVSEAQMWKEISQPPFFVAYQGFYTEGLNVGKFLPTQQTWQLPAGSGASPAKWDLKDSEGQKQSFTKAPGKDGHWIVTTHQIASDTTLELNVMPDNGGYKLYSLSAWQNKHTMLVTFKQPLFINKNSSAQADFQIEFDKQKLSQGTVNATAGGAALSLDWHFKGPDWAKTRVIHQQLKFKGGDLAMQVDHLK